MAVSVDSVLNDAAKRSSMVMVLGGMDTGKTTYSIRMAAAALEAGRTVAYVDADIGNTTIGPPACAGLKVLKHRSDLDQLERADLLHFVGHITPERVVLQQVIAASALAADGRRLADLVIVDTTASISGVVGESLKYHKTELIRPDRIIALHRGSELEPVVGMIGRFFSIPIDEIPADPDLAPSSPDERANRRASRMKIAFAGPLERWRVRPTVFAPTLPVGLDLERLDGVLVGVQDGTGRSLGLGHLEHDGSGLKVVTNAGEGMQGLRLGSLKIDLATFACRPVNLRELIFGI